jgi:hypothetical protein
LKRRVNSISIIILLFTVAMFASLVFTGCEVNSGDDGFTPTPTSTVTPTATATITVTPTITPAGTVVFFSDFEADNGGFQVENYASPSPSGEGLLTRTAPKGKGKNIVAESPRATGVPSWEWGSPDPEPTETPDYWPPYDFPRSAHSGSKCWGTNLTGLYFNDEYDAIVSSNIDLSAHTGKYFVLDWWQLLNSESGYDCGIVEVSKNGGSTWTPIYLASNYFIYEFAGESEMYIPFSQDPEWTWHTAVLDPSYAVSNFRIRYSFASDGSVTSFGYYVDDVSVIAIAPDAAPVYSQDFEASNGGFETYGTNFDGLYSSWVWGPIPTPTYSPYPSAPPQGGTKVWSTTENGGFYDSYEDSYLESPKIDLSAYAGKSFVFSWWMWVDIEYYSDAGIIEISNDGGSSWKKVIAMTNMSNDIVPSEPYAFWANPAISLDPSYAVSNFQVRFRLVSDPSTENPGFFLDDFNIYTY